MLFGSRILFGMASLTLLSTVVNAAEDEVRFDIAALKARGIDPSFADLFSKAPRFLLGIQMSP